MPAFDAAMATLCLAGSPIEGVERDILSCPLPAVAGGGPVRRHLATIFRAECDTRKCRYSMMTFGSNLTRFDVQRPKDWLTIMARLSPAALRYHTPGRNTQQFNISRHGARR